jgi:hypothetical protein
LPLESDFLLFVSDAVAFPLETDADAFPLETDADALPLETDALLF